MSSGHVATEQPSSSTDDSSPGCTPKQRTQGHVSHVARSRDPESADHAQEEILKGVLGPSISDFICNQNPPNL